MSSSLSGSFFAIFVNSYVDIEIENAQMDSTSGFISFSITSDFPLDVDIKNGYLRIWSNNRKPEKRKRTYLVQNECKEGISQVLAGCAGTITFGKGCTSLFSSSINIHSHGSGSLLWKEACHFNKCTVSSDAMGHILLSDSIVNELHTILLGVGNIGNFVVQERAFFTSYGKGDILGHVAKDTTVIENNFGQGKIQVPISI